METKHITQRGVLTNCDCMSALCDLQDESVDLVVLDPNYNEWDKLCEQGLICQAVRVLKPTGNIICHTKQPFDYNLRREINYIFRREIVWTFCNGGAWVSNRMPLVSFQKIYWCTVSNDFYFNPRTGIDYAESTKDFKRTNKVFDGYNEEGREFKKSKDGVWLRDHLHYNKPMCGKIPAKPLELVQIMLRCFCPQGGVVLDPFIGSGTTAVAAIKEGRRYIGYELDKDNYNKAVNAIENQLSITTLTAKKMEEFQQVIKAYLDQRAQEDAQFADNYAKKGKSIEKCCNYILRQAKKRGNAVAMLDDEVYGLAVHYYDEDIPADECRPVSGASRVNAPKVELTEEEKAAAREQAVAEYRNQQVAAMRREEREKKQREAQKQRERKEKFESMQLSIFGV